MILHRGDRALCRRHTKADLCALESRACRRGAAHEFVAAAQGHLAVGAHVNEQHRLAGLVHIHRQQISGNIAAHIARNGGCKVDAAIEGETPRFGIVIIAEEGQGSEGCDTDGIGLQTCQNMAHGGVGCHGHKAHLSRRDLRLAAEVFHHLTQLLADDLRHLLKATLNGGLDTGDNVCTIAALGVAFTCHGNSFAVFQVQQVAGNSGCTNIHRHAVTAQAAVAGKHGIAAQCYLQLGGMGQLHHHAVGSLSLTGEVCLAANIHRTFTAGSIAAAGSGHLVARLAEDLQQGLSCGKGKLFFLISLLYENRHTNTSLFALIITEKAGQLQ